MNGLINKAIQCFLRDGWGMPAWLDAARAAGIAPRGFEPLLDYPPEVTARLLQADRRGRQVFYVVGDSHIRSMLTDMVDHVAEGEVEADAASGA